MRLSGIHGIHDVTIHEGGVLPDRRRTRDMSKAGITVQEPDGGFKDDDERLRLYGLIP